MISVLQVSTYYQQFFESMIYESVKHNDNLLTEWHYFTSLLQKEPLDINRIQTYLGILGLKKANQSQNSEPNIDTDYEESESSSEDEQDFEQKEQEITENSEDKETIQKAARKRKIPNIFNEEEDENEINRGVMVLQQRQNYEELPSKNYQGTPKRSTSSTGIRLDQDASELIHDNPSPILKEITSNFHNIQSSTNGHHNRKSILKQIIQNDAQTHSKESTYKSNSENIYNSIQSRIHNKHNNLESNNADLSQQKHMYPEKIHSNKKITLISHNSTENNHQKGIINLQNSFGGNNCSNSQGKISPHSLQSSQSSTTNKQQKQPLSVSKKDLLKGLSINQVQITPTSQAPFQLKDNILGSLTQSNRKFTETPSGKKDITLLKATPHHAQGQFSQNPQSHHGQFNQIPNDNSTKSTIESGQTLKELPYPVDQDNQLTTTPKYIPEKLEDNKEKRYIQAEEQQQIEHNQPKSKDASSVKKSQVRVIYRQEDVTIPPSTPAILSRQHKALHENHQENTQTSSIPSTPPPQFKTQSSFHQITEKNTQQQQQKQHQLLPADQQNQHQLSQTSYPPSAILLKQQPQPSLSPNILPVSHTSMHSPAQLPQVPQQQASPMQFQQRQIEKKELQFPSSQLKNQISGLLSLFEDHQIQINQLVSHNSSNNVELNAPSQAALQHSFSHPQRQQSSRFPLNQLLYGGPKQTLANGINNPIPAQTIPFSNRTKISPNITKQPQSYQLPSFIQQTSSPEIPLGGPIPVAQYKVSTQQPTRSTSYTVNSQPFISSQCINSTSPMSVKGTLTQPLVQFRTGERSASHYSREACPQDNQSRTFFKRMKTFDNYALDTSQGGGVVIPKCLNKTMDETLSSSSNNNNNHNNSFTRMTMNTSKISVNQPVQQIHITSNINNTSIHETNRLLTHSTNNLPHNESMQSRKRGDYSFPDLKSFNKFIQR